MIQGQSQPQQSVVEQYLAAEEASMSDVPAEYQLLSCLMQYPTAMLECMLKLRPESFYYEKHRLIFDLMLFVYQTCIKYGWAPSFNTSALSNFAAYVGPEYAQMFRNPEVFNELRSMERTGQMQDPGNIPQLTWIVSDLHKRRMLFWESRKTQKELTDRATFPSMMDVAMRHEQNLQGIAFQGSQDVSQLQHIAEAEARYINQISLVSVAPDINYVPLYCFPSIAERLNGGWKRKGLMVVCGRPKTGKSTFGMTVAIQTALAGIPVLYLDREMSVEEQYSRGLAHVSSTNEWTLLKGRVFKENEIPGVHSVYDNVSQAMSQLRNAPFYYANVAGQSNEYVRSIIRQFKHRFVSRKTAMLPNGQTFMYDGPGLVCYDWLKLPEGSASSNVKEYQAIGDICTSLKDTMGECDLAGLTFCQQNKAGIKQTIQDWTDNADDSVGASDRITQFCTGLAFLRPVKDEEFRQVQSCLPKRKEGFDDIGSLYYNQAFHLFLQRFGGDCKRGIPMYLRRGYAQYHDVSSQFGEQGKVVPALFPKQDDPGADQYEFPPGYNLGGTSVMDWYHQTVYGNKKKKSGGASGSNGHSGAPSPQQESTAVMQQIVTESNGQAAIAPPV